MFCERCGAEITASTKICSVCGVTHKTASPNSYNYYEKSNQSSSINPPIHFQAKDAPTIAIPSLQNNQKAYEHILALELFFALFGIYGIGWIKAHESTIGALLLAGSICIYWPTLIYGTIYTWGLGLICLSPLAISTIIIDIVILKRHMRRLASAKGTATRPEPPSL